MVQYQQLSAYDVNVVWSNGQGAPVRLSTENKKLLVDTNELANRLDNPLLAAHTHTLSVTSSAPNIAPVAQGQISDTKPSTTRVQNLRAEEVKYHLHTHTYRGVVTTNNPSITYTVVGSFTDPTLTIQMKPRITHINELRKNLEDLKNHTHYGCECQCECTCPCTCTCTCDCTKHNCICY